jgi:glycosyltransferase involved in cell wall biosynthesis
MRSIFILTPSMRPVGPVKGAVALANALVGERRVTLVSLKGGSGADAVVDQRVQQVSLPDSGNLWQRLGAYRRMLSAAGGREAVASISWGFSADVLNLMCRDLAVTCASVRGNLRKAYTMTYGFPGAPLAITHLTMLRKMDHVVAMTSAMAHQVSRYIGRTPAVIGNFVDEPALDPYRPSSSRAGPLRLVFLGRLVPGKRPSLVVDAVKELRDTGVDVCADIVGDGPLTDSLASLIKARGLGDSVAMHGYQQAPYQILADADAMVLPSDSEGLARSALEALYLGVPCVLRNTDGNGELVETDVNGVLFDRDPDFAAACLKAARLGRAHAPGEILLPPHYRQQAAARKFLQLVENP